MRDVEDKFPKACNFDVEDTYGEKHQDPDRRRFDQDTKTRLWLSVWVVSVSSLWLLFVVLVVCFCHFRMSGEIIIALLCTTTANILGLPYIVLHGLFDNGNNNRK